MSLLVLGVASCFVLPMIFVLLFSVSSIVDWTSFCCCKAKHKKEIQEKRQILTVRTISLIQMHFISVQKQEKEYIRQIISQANIRFRVIFFYIMFCYIYNIVTEIHMFVQQQYQGSNIVMVESSIHQQLQLSDTKFLMRRRKTIKTRLISTIIKCSYANFYTE